MSRIEQPVRPARDGCSALTPCYGRCPGQRAIVSDRPEITVSTANATAKGFESPPAGLSVF
jgi:hypothetical protein